MEAVYAARAAQWYVFDIQEEVVNEADARDPFKTAKKLLT